ncbi:MAG TPA: LamG-like jellyroll fold domain-containing protein, partial [Kofleriaceae bacterium]
MRALVLVTLVGCGFDPSPAMSVDASSGNTGGDASMTIDAPGSGSSGSGSSGSGSNGVAPCYAPDMGGIVLCLELDDADLTGNTGTALDGAPGHHDAMVTDSDATTRSVPAASQAETISTTLEAPQVTIQAENSGDFDLQQFTLMAWVEPTATPESGNSYGIIEKYNQYLLAIDDDGDLLCEAQGTDDIGISVGDVVPQNSWSLVACTYDGTHVCTLVLPGGSGDSAQLHCEDGPDPATLETGSTNGPVIGGRYDGSV